MAKRGEERMKACVVKINTVIDGVERSVQKSGEMSLDTLSATLVYNEDGAMVTLTLENDVLNVLRVGDYSLQLRIEEGKEHFGKLGIGGSIGEIAIRTKKLTYSLTRNSWLLLAKYTLLTGGEPQETSIRIQAKFRG
jgi:uncharacterized beta-barrel protein YwiB (DUF1934 family)